MSHSPEADHTVEHFDILDAAGNLTGRALPKDEVHSLGLLHRDVHVWVTDGTYMYQQQRAWDKAIMPGAWDVTVAGHVSASEDFLDAAVRETAEEIGLKLPREEYMALGSLATELTIDGWSEPHRTIGGNYALYVPGLQLSDLQQERGAVIGLRAYPLDKLVADMQTQEGRALHAPHPQELWQIGIDGMHRAAQLASK